MNGAYGNTQKAVGTRLAADFERASDLWRPCWRDVLPDSKYLTFEQVAEKLKELWDALKDEPLTKRYF